jgi:stage III sporulation protein AH
MKIRNMKQVKEHVKDMNMKRLFRRNQIIITTLAVMIAAAGYLNYAGKKDLAANSPISEVGLMDISDEDVFEENQAAALSGQTQLEEIPSLDQDLSDLEEADNTQTGLENPGEAVLTSGMSVADYIANVQLSREQVRARNKETLMNLINSTSIDEAAKQQAIQEMLALTQISEKENAAETLLLAKGFADPVVSISSEKVDVVINAASITDPERAQIEDIVKRKAEVGADQIIITLLNMAQ